MRVVITGGTGFVGRRLAALLAARGDDVLVLTRGGAHVAGRGIAFAEWTPQQAGDWQLDVEDSECVVSLAGAGVMDARWTDARLAEVRASRVEPTRLVAEAIARSARRPAFVSASAVGIYGMRAGAANAEPLDESGAHGTDVLASLCEAWEAATERAARAGARVALARLGIVLGADGGALPQMVRPFRAFAGGPIGDGAQYVSWIHADDAARALLHAIDEESFAGAFNVTAPSPVTNEEMAHAIGRALHRPSFARVPAFALRAALGARAEVLLTGQRALPKRLEDAGFAFAFPRVDAALTDILGRE